MPTWSPPPTRSRSGPAALLLLLSVAAAPSARAQEEVCTEQVRASDWRAAMDAVDDALSDGNGVLAGRILDDTAHVLRCAVEIVTPQDLGRLARQRSLLGFYAQDDVETERWGLLARETLGFADWPPELDVPEAYHEMIDELPEATRAGPEGRGWAVPRGGLILVDGRVLQQPRVSVDVPHLVQVVDKKQQVVVTRWQDGSSFASDLLGEAAGPVEPPRWFVPPPPPAARPAPSASAPEPVAAVAAPTPAAPAKIITFDMGQIGMVCQWTGDPREVEVSKSVIFVNRQKFPVERADDRAELVKALRICGEFRAVRHFDRWVAAGRSSRRHEEMLVSALLTKEPVIPEASRAESPAGSTPGAGRR